MTISATIKFGKISKEDFEEFLRVLKIKDSEEYETEAGDGFADLYKYWEKMVGKERFDTKLAENKRAIGE